MGCQESKTDQEKDEDKKSKMLDSMLKKEKYNYLNEIKLLLLGTGESGKSTIAKQMKILHTSGFTEDELIIYRPAVYKNVVQSIVAIIQYIRAHPSIHVLPENEERMVYFETLKLDDQQTQPFSKDTATNVQILWKDPGIQVAYEKRNEYQLMDGAAYCFENVDRFVSPQFVPTPTDVLRVRVRTTGITETTFRVKESSFRMVDVGGQRSERKKWIHCFQDVTAIIYCAALNEYDMKLFEDEKVNRMEESLELFEEICNSKWFTKTAMILFLNKYDLFKEKIEKTSLKILFEDYEGGNNEKDALDFIQRKFCSLNRNSNKKIFVHPTCATDTEQVKVVFDAAKEIIISQNLERLGFGPL